MLVQADSKELVVYVSLVWIENRRVVFHSYDYYAKHVEGGHYHQTVCKGETHFLVWHIAAEQRDVVFAAWNEVGTAHCKFDGEEAEHEADGEASRIAHENLQSLFRIAEDVVVHVSQQDSHQSGDENAVDIQFYAIETIQESSQCNECEPCCQSVDAVDEVHGVVDECYAEHRERESHGERYLVDAAESV